MESPFPVFFSLLFPELKKVVGDGAIRQRVRPKSWNEWAIPNARETCFINFTPCGLRTRTRHDLGHGMKGRTCDSQNLKGRDIKRASSGGILHFDEVGLVYNVCDCLLLLPHGKPTLPRLN